MSKAERRNEAITIRVFPSQRKIIEKMAEKESLNLTNFLRKAIFTYIDQINNNVKLLCSEEIEPKLSDILNLSKIIQDDIEYLNKKLKGGN